MTDLETIVRRHCDRVNPPIPGGCKCSYPKCHQAACAAVIQDAVKYAGKVVEGVK